MINKIIYSKEEIGTLKYFIDQENPPIEGFRKCLKLIKSGEVIKFILPSQLAHGYKGDRNKIEANTPIICTIETKEIIKKQAK